MIADVYLAACGAGTCFKSVKALCVELINQTLPLAPG